MYNEKIKEILASIGELEGTINNQATELKNKLDANDLEGAKGVKASREENKAKLEELKNELALYEAAMEPAQTKPVGNARQMESDEPTYRDRVNNFIRSKGAETAGLKFEGNEVVVPYDVIKNEIVPTTDGIKRADVEPVISEEEGTLAREVKTVVDLKRFVNTVKVTKAKGSHPILKRANTRMISVAELEKNPALAKPEFDSIGWEVLTYRGAIPLSQESIDDADVDLMELVQEQVNEIKLNTTNYAIAEVMKTFTPVTVSGLDDLKLIHNVTLDPAYTIAYVVSQSFYQFLDTVKDENGRYLLQDSIISPTGKVFSGKTLHVVSDEALGAEGEARAWVGDMKRAILFADRKNLGLRWADHEIYGQYLQAVTRFDVKVADANAGRFLTYEAPTTAPAGE